MKEKLRLPGAGKHDKSAKKKRKREKRESMQIASTIYKFDEEFEVRLGEFEF